MEREQITAWQASRPGERIVEVDVPLSYGAFDIVQDVSQLNTVEFLWDATKEVGVYIKVKYQYERYIIWKPSTIAIEFYSRFEMYPT